MDIVQGKHFSITDPKGINTVIYQVNKTEKEYLKDFPKYTVERLDYTSEIRGDSTRKTYFVDEPSPEGNQLVILSFGKEKVVINMGILLGDEVKITKKPTISNSFSGKKYCKKSTLLLWLGRIEKVCKEEVRRSSNDRI